MPALRDRRMHWCKFPIPHVPIFLAYIKTASNLYFFVHVFSRRKRKGGEEGSNRIQMQWLEYQTEKRRHRWKHRLGGRLCAFSMCIRWFSCRHLIWLILSIIEFFTSNCGFNPIPKYFFNDLFLPIILVACSIKSLIFETCNDRNVQFCF